MIYSRQFSWYESTSVNIIGTIEGDNFPPHLKSAQKEVFQTQGVFINFEVKKPKDGTFEIIIDSDLLGIAGQYRHNSDMDTYITNFIKDIHRHQRHIKLNTLLE